MSDYSKHEMTLHEWVNRLPVCHKARDELQGLEADNDRLRDALREITEQGGTGEDADVMYYLAYDALRETT